MSRDFRKSVAWQKADDLAVRIYEVAKGFPKDEIYGLTSQLRRAAVSVPANIAEGSGKHFLKEFLQYLYIAISSLSEVEYYLHLGKRLCYLNDALGQELEGMRRDTAIALNGLINLLDKQIASGQIENRPPKGD